MNYAELAVGDEVAVSRSGRYNTHSEGVYTVIKANKLKVVLQRASDGLRREFSVKRGAELGMIQSRAFIESVAALRQREAQYAAQRDCKQAWVALEQAAHDRNPANVRAALAVLIKMVDEPFI